MVAMRICSWSIRTRGSWNQHHPPFTFMVTGASSNAARAGAAMPAVAMTAHAITTLTRRATRGRSIAFHSRPSNIGMVSEERWNMVIFWTGGKLAVPAVSTAIAVEGTLYHVLATGP